MTEQQFAIQKCSKTVGELQDQGNVVIDHEANLILKSLSEIEWYLQKKTVPNLNKLSKVCRIPLRLKISTTHLWLGHG